jgi:iron complex outermembrane receptor protein
MLKIESSWAHRLGRVVPVSHERKEANMLKTYRCSGPAFSGRSAAAYSALQVVVALAVTVGAAGAQQIRGIVSSAEGQPIGGAVVRPVGGEMWAMANASGAYAFPASVGTYLVEASALGYRTVRQEVTVGVGQVTNLNFTLESRPLALDGISVSVLRPDLLPEASLAGREVEEANPKDAGELLRALDGVEAVRRGPLGLDPVVRGLRETEVGTYLDGARMFPAGPARMDSPLTHLDPSAIRSIQVVKGPYALTWGAGNLSAIRVETQPLPLQDSRPAGSLGVGYDSNLQASETTGKIFGKRGRVSYFAMGAWRQGDDYKSGADRLIQGDFESWEGRGKVGFDLGENSRVVVGGGYQEQGPIDYPGRLLNADFFESTNFSATFNWSGLGTVRGLEVQAYRNAVDHGMTNEGKPTALDDPMRMPPFALDITVASEMTVAGGRAAADLYLNDAWSAEVGGDVYLTNRDALRQIRNAATQMLMFESLMWPDADIDDIGAFGRLAWTDGRTRVAGTVRADFVSASAPTASAYFLANVGTDLDDSETNLSGAVTISTDLSPNWTLALGAGSVVRTADASERYSDRVPASKAQTAAEFMGNPQLAPERSNQVDLWVDGGFERFAIHVGAFVRRIDDYVTIEATSLTKLLPLSPNTVFQYVNGEATFRGLDASFTAGLSDVLTLDGGVTYLRGQDTELDEPALGVAPFRTSVGLRYEEPLGRFYVEGSVNLVAEQKRQSKTRGETESPAYETGDVRAGFGLPNGITLRTGVLNIWNEDYVNHLNAKDPFTGLQIGEPGRVLFVDVVWSL